MKHTKTPDPTLLRSVRAALALQTLQAADRLRAAGLGPLADIFEQAARREADAVAAEERAAQPPPTVVVHVDAPLYRDGAVPPAPARRRHLRAL